MSDNHLFVGLDVYKATIAIAVAERGRAGEVRYIGSFPNKPASIISQLKGSVAKTPETLVGKPDVGLCAWEPPQHFGAWKVFATEPLIYVLRLTLRESVAFVEVKTIISSQRQTTDMEPI